MPHDFEAWWAGLGPEGDEWPKKALAAAAHGTGLAAERARIRKELLKAIDFATLRGERAGHPVQQQSSLELEIRAALDSIIPGQPGDPPLSEEDDAFLAEHRAEIEAMIGEAALKGADWERARIRKELLESLEPEIRAHRIAGCGGVEVDAVLFSDIRAALDRICPEGKEE